REAREVINRSLEIRRERLGERHQEYQTGLLNYAIFLHRGREFTEAEPLYRQVIAYRIGRFGPDALETALAQSSLAVMLLHSGDLDEGGRLLSQVEAVRKVKLEPDHPLIADTMHNLGGLYLERGQPADALEKFRGSAAARAAKNGEHSYTHAASLYTQA